MKLKIIIALTALLLAGTVSAKNKILVNSEVTTMLVMPENIKLVDISTDKVAGNQCTDNIVRIKPVVNEDSVQCDYYANEPMGTISVIGERYMAQYELVYTQSPYMATSYHEVSYLEAIPYTNPDVSMPKYEMARYAWAVYGSPRKFNNITSNEHGIKARVNNIYSVGDYFFIDYSLDNKTKIPYDIAELRIKLTDKKEVKATNSQTTELLPVYSLNVAEKFNKNYRNVVVLEKLTFLDEKVLTIEISENQISGRTVTLTIEYDDILNADAFDSDILKNRIPKLKKQ